MVVLLLYRFFRHPSIHSQAAEDKANHLNRVKYKLEQNLDELEDSVEREKKVDYIMAIVVIV